MATFKYVTGAIAIGTGQVDLLTANICAALVGSGYGPNAASDQFLSDIPDAAIISDEVSLVTLSLANGVFSGLIPQYMSLLSVQPAAALVLYVSTGDPDTSQLLYYSSDGFGFPLALEGFNYYVTYDQANGGWFQI